MGRNASIIHASRKGKQDITDQFLFKKKLQKRTLLIYGMKTEFDREGNKLCIMR